MANKQSFIFKKDAYIDSTGITHNRKLLSDVFKGQESMGSIIVEDITCKNLFDYNNLIVSKNLSISINNNELIVTRTASGGGFVYYTISNLEVGQNYTITSNSKIIIYKDIIYGEAYKSVDNALQGYVFKAEQSIYIIAIIIGSADISTIGNTLNCGKVQLEKGNVATSFVEYKEFGYTNIDSTNIIHNGKLLSELLKTYEYITNANFDSIYSDNYNNGIKLFAIGGGNLIGAPKDCYNYGILINIGINNNYTNTQIYIEDNIGNTEGRYIYVRIRNDNWLKLSGTFVSKIV